MRLCEETITVFNAKLNPATDRDEYRGTVISGVSWFCETIAAVDGSGLKAASKYTVRIPEDAHTCNHRYVTPNEYEKAERIRGIYTLKPGDIVVHGAVNVKGLLPAQLLEKYEAFTILGVTDNSRAPHAPHRKVVGA